MQLTLGRHCFTLSGNDALFVAEAILLQQRRFVGRTCSQRAQKTRCNFVAAGEGTHTRESPRH